MRPTRTLTLTAVAAVALVGGLITWPATSSSSGEVCDKFGSERVGRYIAQNNVWGADTTQCIDVTEEGFRISRAGHDKKPGGPPASFPSLYYGWHGGYESPGTDLPARVSSDTVRSMRTSAEFRYVSEGVYNATYDIWLDPEPRKKGKNTGAEIMVWTGHRGGVQPIGDKVDTVRMLGGTWEVWVGDAGWNVVSYVRTEPTASISFPLRLFLDDAVERGQVKRDWYLTSVQVGFEPWKGGTGLAVRDFAVSTGG